MNKTASDNPLPEPRLAATLLMLARIAVAGWVVAAALYVGTSVTEQRSPAFDSFTRDTLALIRFPWYYGFGFSLLSCGLICGTLAGVLSKSPGRWRLFAALIAVALLLMTADYFAIYRPLRAMITPPGQARSAEFVTYHTASRHINEVGLTLSLIAAGVICWPQPVSSARPQQP